MCIPAVIAGVSQALGIGAGATAAGATASAATAGATFGGTLQAIGAATGIVGSIAQGIGANRAAKTNASLIEQQKAAEAQKSAVEDQRTRREWRSAMSRQRAELAARGVGLDSPTAVLLGQTAAREMSFASQGVRQSGAATQLELTAAQRATRARGVTDMLAGYTSAASLALTAAPRLWPELAR
jgi:hypothetical protein